MTDRWIFDDNIFDSNIFDTEKIVEAVITKHPTERKVITAGWIDPANALQSNDQYTYTSATDLPKEEYYSYGFSVPANAVIDEVLVRVECKGSDPTNEDLWIYVYDGIVWSSYYNIAYTPTETVIDVDVTSFLNTPAKINASKVQIYHRFVGGCYPPRTEFLGVKGKRFVMLEASQIKVGDVLIGLDKDTRKFKKVKVVTAKKHIGKWKIIRVYVKIPKAYINATIKHPELKQLFNLTKDIEVLSDLAWTDNHPVHTRNRGRITAGELKVGDILGELFWDGKLYSGGVRIDFIEVLDDYEGDVYDIRAETEWIFGRYLLGHVLKD